MFSKLVEKYLMPDPKGFRFVAARVKEGKGEIAIRDELMATTGASRLAAGKLVQECIRAIKVSRANLFSGAIAMIGGLLLVLFSSNSLLYGIALMVTGIAQFSAGRQVRKKYQEAGETAKSASVVIG